MSRTVSRLARLRTAAGLGTTLILASCLYAGPPRVAPSATLSPGDDAVHGPRSRSEFAVSFAGPRGLVATGDDAAVTVLFNRAMRTLEAPEDAGLPRVTVMTKDGRTVTGVTRWVGTRGLIFTPTAELPGASDFVVTVAQTARSLDGAELRAPYVFEFQTSLPAVTATWPPSGARSVRADETFQIHFNHDVAPEAVAKVARLVVRHADGEAGVPIALRASRPPPSAEKDPARKGAEHVIVLTPDKPLPLDAGLELTLGAGLASTEGPRVSDQPFTLAARTYGPLRLVSFHCPRIAPGGACRARNDVKVTLSNPVTPDEFHRHVDAPGILAKAAPTAGKKKKEQKETPGPSQWLLAEPQLGKKYRVTLKAGMTDLFGQKLARDQSFEIDTEAPFTGRSPAVAAASARPAAPNRSPDAPPAAAGPRRASLKYELELGLTGHVVEALSSTGIKSHRVPVSSVNVATYELAAAALAEPQALAWLGGGATRDFLDRNHIVPDLVTPGAPDNVRAVRPLDLDALLASSRGRGAAFVLLDVPGDAPVAPRLLTVTDLGVTAKLSHFGSLVWVTSLSSGAPVAGATVTVRAPGAPDLFTGTTDPDGVLAIPADAYDPVPPPGEKKRAVGDAFAFVRSGDDWTYQKLARSNADAHAAAGFQDLSSRSEWLGTLFTDRGVYRPGETVKAGGIFRAIDAAGLHAVAGKEVRIEVSDGRGSAVLSTRAKLDAFGAFAVDLAVPKTAHLGDARVVAELRDHGRAASATETFRLLAFKASEFKVAVEPASPTYVRGDEAQFTVHGDYLFGAPMGESPIHTTMTRELASFVPPGADAFVVSDEAGVAGDSDASPKASDLTASDDKLDTDGRFSRKARLALPGQRGPERVTFEAEVEDVSRQTVAARASVLVHPGELYAALRAPTDRFVDAGGLFHADVAALEPSGAHRAGVPLTIELFERTWVGAVEEQGDGSSHRTSRAKDERVASCAVVSTSATSSCDLKVPEGGFYVVRLTLDDPRGNRITASTSFHGIEGRQGRSAPVAWAESDARVVTLEANKKSYEPGEQARFLVRNPFKEADALVTVERNGVLWRRRAHLSGPMPVLTIPVEASFYPNAYVSVHLVRGRVESPPEKGVDLGAPEFRMGYGRLDVNPEAHRLRVDIAPEKKEYHPGEDVDADLVVTDRGGAPVESELTFYAVDQGVLMLTGYKTPDPLPAFTRSRRLAVFTAENREGLAHVLPLRAGERVPVLGFELLQAQSAPFDKGNPGGDGGAGGLRADFRSTAYFEAGKVTSKEGRAHVHFKLPDNLTSFRLMAVAAGTSDYFGSGEATITTSRKLMARPALPRQLRVGDVFEASVALSSRELPATDVAVTLLTTGVEASGPATQTVRLPSTGSVEARFPVKVTAPGEATFEFALKAGAETDRVRVKRQVELATSMESVAAYGETTSAAAIALGDLRGVRPDRGGLSVKVSPTALVGLSAGLDRLLDYPYGCTEQLASRTLPLLSLRDLATDYGAHLPAKLDVALEDAVDKLLKHQRDDGGFGFWEDSPASEPWLSAYTTLTLVEAKKQARFVPAEAVDSAIRYLETTLRSVKIGDEQEDSVSAGDDDAGTAAPAAEVALSPEKVAALDYANAAFVADVLATIGKPDPGFLHRLYDGRAGKPLFARALLLHGMAAAGMSQAELDGLARELEARLRIGANDAVADAEPTELFEPMLDSSARTTALVLRAFIATDRAHPLASRLARGLLALRVHGGAWRSTQENGWALMALRDYRAAQESSHGDVEVRAFLGPDELLHRVFRAGSDRETTIALGPDRVAGAGGEAVSFQVAGKGQLFYSAELRYASSVLPDRPRDEGFFVQKMMRALRPEELEEASQWLPKRTAETAKAGDLVLIDVLLESSEPRTQVVLDDPLPAGLEAVDYDLETTARARRVGDERAQPVADAGKPKRVRPDELSGIGAAFQTATVHREAHDDRVLTFIEDLAPGMYHFRYVARATAIGRFVLPPTRVECMYQPEVYGQTAASHFEVTAKKP